MGRLGANPAEDAVYPLAVMDAEGSPINGDNAYVMHFDAGQIPPVDAFWSLTMYDAEGFQVANPINRFAIGDRDDLVYGPDGPSTSTSSKTTQDPTTTPTGCPLPQDRSA
jgi:hypothetical protein